MLTPRALLPIALALALAGCRCDGPTATNKAGDLNFVYDQGGVTITGPQGDLNFGKVAMGVKKTLKLTLQNRGDGPLDLVSLEKVDGEAVKLEGGLDEPQPVFTVSFSPMRLTPGSTAEFDAEFDAPLEADPSVRTKDHQVQLQVNVANAITASGAVVLHGTAISGQCNVPDTLDFGAVATGDTFKRAITIENDSPLPAVASAGAITSNSGDDHDFMYAAESATGDFSIDTGLKRDIVIAFKPTESKDYVAFVKVRAAEQCPEVSVKLLGQGVDQVLSCVPNPLDFGYVTPGLSTQAELTLSNSSLLPISLTAAAARSGTVLSPDFKLLGADAITVPGATREVQPDGSKSLVAGTVKVQLLFQPTLLGPRTASVSATTMLEKQPQLQCPLKGVGGGPDIDVRPGSSLDFGRVPYFATAPKPFFVTRKITVQNVGTLPNPPDPRANLHLGSGTQANNWPKPYFRVVPKNTDSLESEICVGLFDDVNFPASPCRNDLPLTGPGRYDPGVGIVAATGMSMLDVPIRITPTSANKSMEWDVVILSNDPDEPEVTVNVKAQSVVLPPCNFQLSPASLNFGLVTPPAYRDLSFAIKNLGVNAGDICLITNLDLKAGSDPLYSLPNGPLDQYEMQPMETVNVTVRATPTGAVGTTVMTALGSVLFGISSPLTPQREVALSTSVATSCLTVAPADLDFGTVQKDCNSSHRTFAVYNTCSTAVTVNSWSMVAAAGVPGGSTPSCPGPSTSTCPEFLIDGTPSFVMGTQLMPGAAMPATFTLKYHPLDFGADTGAFLLKVTQSGQVVDYIVTLRGKGDTVGLNVDTFLQDPRPKADILLVIDNSCSMADKQTALSQNFASFIHYASTANVDYQIGIITTDLTSNVEGQLLQEMSATGTLNPKILKPSTPNVEAIFTTRVKVGINGGTEGMAEPAAMALTAPLISSANAGFLRADAVLAVVIVSDAGDQSPLAATVYENQLRNIKGVQHASQFSYNDIGPFAAAPPAGCSYDDFTDISKNIYLVQLLNGVKDEICTANWAQTLEDIGKTAFGYRTHFFLTAEPDLTSGHDLVVRIDGVQIAQVDPFGASVWSYDPATNAINFEPLFVPEPGKTLTVEYYVQCQ
jgi:hypothetical protein